MEHLVRLRKNDVNDDTLVISQHRFIHHEFIIVDARSPAVVIFICLSVSASSLRRPIIHSLCTSSVERLMTSIDHLRHRYLAQTIILSSIKKLNSVPADYSNRVFLLLLPQ